MHTTLSTFSAALLRVRLGILAIIAVVLPFAAWSQEYTVKDLGNLGYASSNPTGVNNSGQVVGYSISWPATEQDDGFGVTSPFIYSNGAMSEIGSPAEGFLNYALAINNDGVVVGAYDGDDFGGHLAAFQFNGAFQSLTPINNSFAVAINQDGVAAGVSGYVEDPVNYNFGDLHGGVPIGVTFNNGAITDIPKGSYLGIGPTGINNAQQISGLCFNAQAVPLGCVVSNGAPQLIKPVKAFSGNVQAYPAAINALGYMCGDSYLGGTYDSMSNIIDISSSAATYWRNNTGFLLGHPANTKATWCTGMDDYGNGVGGATLSNGSAQIGTIFDPIHGARDLNSLIPHLFIKGHGFKIINAVSIAGTGYIAAQCLYQNGNNDACLLTPNTVLILHDTILELAAHPNVGCGSCMTHMKQEAELLPKSLAGLTTTEKEGVITTIEQIGSQIQTLQTKGLLSEPDALLLTHDAELVVYAIQPPR